MTTWVLLRGLAREAGHWGGFLEKFADALQPGDRMIALDLPGNGTLHGARSPLTVAAMAAACRHSLRERGAPPPYVLVAMSLGGMVALQWSQQFPEEMAGCVLINSSAGGRNPFWERLRPRNYARVLRLLLPGLPVQARERRVLAMTSANPGRHPQAIAQWAAIAQERPVSVGNVVRQLVAAARYRQPGTPPAVPVLLLASVRDQLVSPRCSLRLASLWAVPLVLHLHAGHDLPLDDPEWVIDQIQRWWRDR